MKPVTEADARRAAMAMGWVAQKLRNGEPLKTNERRTLVDFLEQLGEDVKIGKGMNYDDVVRAFRNLW